MNRENIHKIDLHLPSGWMELTTTQLEQMAEALLKYGKADGDDPLWKVKCHVFFRWNGLEILSNNGKNVWMDCDGDTIVRVQREGIREDFMLNYWMVVEWIKEKLNWMNGPVKVLRFPYPTFRKRRFLSASEYSGPDALMQNFCYRQYRVAGEYLSYYLMMNNKLAAMRKNRQTDPFVLDRQIYEVRKAQSLVMASLYNRKVKHIDKVTGRRTASFLFIPGQSEMNRRDFEGFSDVQFQCILLWWNSMTTWLGDRFPKVFRRKDVGRSRQTNPLDVYRQTVTVMEKYLTGMNEERVNNEMYMNVLQHLQNILDENDRMKELERKSN